MPGLAGPGYGLAMIAGAYPRILCETGVRTRIAPACTLGLYLRYTAPA